MYKDYIGTIYTGVSDRFQRGLFPIARCIKAEKADLAVVEVINLTEGVDMENGANTIVGQGKAGKVEVIGCMDNTIDNTFESANRVYDTDGLCQTIHTCAGGNTKLKILEVCKLDVNELGFIEHGTGKHQSNTVFGTDGVSPTITTVQGGGTQQIKIVEQRIVAMRGRNPDNPSDRTAGIPTEQRLELQEDNICNCLTSVQKDSLVLETGHYENLIVNDRGFVDKDPQISENICPTIRAETHGNEPKVIKINRVVNGNIEHEEILTDIEIAEKFHGFLYEIDGELYLIRIRKLVPRECGRLMGVDDESITKMLTTNSNSQCYRQYGNSIVTMVLMGIFSQLHINGVKAWNDMTENEINYMIQNCK